MHIGPWDILLIAGVSTQATVMAYVHHPKWKTLVYSIPIPFTLASLSLGRPIGVTNVSGLFLLLVYAHSVRLLHLKLRVPIVGAIIVSALAYCAIAAALVPVLPQTSVAFWVVAGLAWILSGALLLSTAHRDEPGHRTPLPVWIKLPVIASVIVGLVAMKSILQGFMTMFPMVGVVGAYETRHSLWAFSRQVPVIMLSVVPMMAVCRLTQEHIGLGPALALGWVAMFAFLLPLTRWMWRSAHKASASDNSQGQ